jgi:hypothetical protein
MEYLCGLAQWVALLRGTVVKEQYSGDIAFTPGSEVGTRLAKQLTRLAMGVAIFRREDTLSKYALKLAARVARDTVPSRVEIIVRKMFANLGERQGTSVPEISDWTHLPQKTIRVVLEDLVMLRVATKEAGGGGVWGLNPWLHRLTDSLGMYSMEKSWTGRESE